MGRAARSFQGTPPGDGRFNTTHWSVIVAAGRRFTPRARAALEAICGTYWYPVYVFIRHQGMNADEAQDLTQAFFTRLLEKNDIAAVDRQQGRFRSWLLAAVKHFLANEWDHARAQKRGGGRQVFSFDANEAEHRYQREPASNVTPEKLYERRWALMILEQAMGRLRDDMLARGKGQLFEAMKPFLAGKSPGASLQQIAGQLGMSVGAAYVSLHRLRRRCRELLTETIAQTVDRPEDIEDEVRQLFCALA